MTSDDPLRPVAIASCVNELEAGAVITALEAAGIQARMVGDATSGFRAEAPGEVQVVVHQRDRERARKLLEEIDADHTPIDWSQIDVGDPEP